MSILLKISIGIVILAVIAWGFQISLRSERPEAEHQIDAFYKMLQAEQFGTMVALFDANFFKDNQISADDWVYQMQTIYERLGPIQDFRLESWADTTHKDVGQPGKFYKLNYIVTYAKDTTEETFNLFVPRGSKQLHILSHSINARKLDLRVEKREEHSQLLESYNDQSQEVFIAEGNINKVVENENIIYEEVTKTPIKFTYKIVENPTNNS